MKVIDLSTAPQDERDLALREAHLLSEFDHEHILKYINSFEEGGALCIVTEFCPNGDVGGFLEARNNRALPENRIVSWFREVASALEVSDMIFSIKVILNFIVRGHRSPVDKTSGVKYYDFSHPSWSNKLVLTADLIWWFLPCVYTRVLPLPNSTNKGPNVPNAD